MLGKGARRLLICVLGLGTLPVALARCSVYDTSLLVPAPDKPAPASGVGFWSGAGDRGCFSAKVPRPEDRPPPGSPTKLPPIYLAISSTRLGSLDPKGNLDSNAWQDIGYDLDGVCTGASSCEGTDSPPSCKPTVPQISTDGTYCRDNTFGRLEFTAALVPEIAKKYGLSDDAFNCALCVGDYNYIIKVSDYNGEANDGDVRVDLYPSTGLTKVLPWDCADPSWKTRPCFTPDGVFKIEKGGMVNPAAGPDLPPAKAFDDKAYVRDGYLVLSLKDIFLWFPGYNALVTAYPIQLRKGIASGKLARGADGVWRITDGIIGGRTLAADLVKGFRDIGFCETDSNYGLLVDFVAKNLDVLADGTKDPNRTCDAMSVGIGFQALQAVAGPLDEVEPLKECVLRGGAVDGGTDAGTDAPLDAPKDAPSDAPRD
ncbi:MAG: hypothetical protein JST00_23535 [Deltaproteobacteria bacterium]|nr:hypothetical protein [Deltaproteobacteria bacterium]